MQYNGHTLCVFTFCAVTHSDMTQHTVTPSGIPLGMSVQIYHQAKIPFQDVLIMLQLALVDYQKGKAPFQMQEESLPHS